jgi:hypothetical protein
MKMVSIQNKTAPLNDGQPLHSESAVGNSATYPCTEEVPRTKTEWPMKTTFVEAGQLVRAEKGPLVFSGS